MPISWKWCNAPAKGYMTKVLLVLPFLCPPLIPSLRSRFLFPLQLSSPPSFRYLPKNLKLADLLLFFLTAAFEPYSAFAGAESNTAKNHSSRRDSTSRNSNFLIHSRLFIEVWSVIDADEFKPFSISLAYASAPSVLYVVQLHLI